MVNKTVFQASIRRRGKQRAHPSPFKGTSAYYSLAKTWSSKFTDQQRRLKNVYFSKVCPAKIQGSHGLYEKEKQIVITNKEEEKWYLEASYGF